MLHSISLNFKVSYVKVVLLEILMQNKVVDLQGHCEIIWIVGKYHKVGV